MGRYLGLLLFRDLFACRGQLAFSLFGLFLFGALLLHDLLLDRWRRVSGKGRAAVSSTGADIDKTGLDLNVGILTCLGEIGAQRRLQLAHVEAFLHLAFHLLQRRRTRILMAVNLQDDKALPGADRRGVAVHRQIKRGFFEHIAQHASLEVAQIAPGGGGWPARGDFGNLDEVRATLKLCFHALRLGLGGGDLRIGRGVRRGDQNFAQVNLFR